jgi:uncharacterized protein (DUF488 family)
MIRQRQNHNRAEVPQMTDTIQLFTIGFTKKSARHFFGELQRAGVKRLIDIRLNNSSQLAGFAKKDDLAYFVTTICGIEYLHLPQLAPTAELLDAYKKQHRDWAVYERAFLELMVARRVEETLTRELIDGACLLCSEDRPQQCHRRLVAEYLDQSWGSIAIRHLV